MNLCLAASLDTKVHEALRILTSQDMLLVTLGGLGVKELVCCLPRELGCLLRASGIAFGDDGGGDGSYSRDQAWSNVINDVKEAAEIGWVCVAEVLEVRGVPGDGPPVATRGLDAGVVVDAAEGNAELAVGLDDGVLLMVLIDVAVLVQQ